jgi:hypothetical protein
MKKIMLVDPDDFFTSSNRSKRDGPVIDDLKIYKKWKKFLKKEEEEAKKKAKDAPAKWWERKSVAERTVIIAILGPPCGILYVYGILQLVKLMAETVGVH